MMINSKTPQEHPDESFAQIQQDILKIAPESWLDAGGNGQMQASEFHLYIWQTPQVHRQIAQYLANRFHDLSREVVLECRIVGIDEDVLKKNTSEELKPCGELRTFSADSNSLKELWTDTSLQNQEVSPCDSATIEDSMAAQILRLAHRQKNITTLTAPKATMRNKESATMQVLKDIPFVNQNKQPDSFSEGLSIRVYPEIQEDNKSVDLTIKMAMTNSMQKEDFTPDTIPQIQVLLIEHRSIVPDQKTMQIISPLVSSEFFKQNTARSSSLGSDGTKPNQRILILIQPTIIIPPMPDEYKTALEQTEKI